MLSNTVEKREGDNFQKHKKEKKRTVINRIKQEKKKSWGSC